jgi:soluble lytic murein transglycosylase-like protein
MPAMKMRFALAVLAVATALHAQAPPSATPDATPAKQPDTAPAKETPVSKQRSAAYAMQRSLARQRSSVAKQTGQAEAAGFFVLPPPTRMGATVFAPAADCDPLPAAEVDSLVQQAAKNQNLDEQVLRGVIQQESAFRPCAVSPKGAMGLMQLMPATADQFGVPDPFDPKDNVETGAAFLKQLLARYGGDLTLALGAYNAGPAKVDAAAGVPKIPETQDYVNRVLSTVPVKK